MPKTIGKQLSQRAPLVGPTVGLLAVLCSAAAGCASSPQSAGPQPMAADKGQPRMQAALQALAHAKEAAEAATPNKGGHREQAIQLIQQAFDAVNNGIQYATANATELTEAEGPAPPEPVNEEVPGADRQPNMGQAIVALREARRQLKAGQHDKGGYRQQAIGYIQLAIEQLREGIQSANNQ